MAKRRREAALRAKSIGLPSFTEEVWRYSQIDDLDLDRYTVARGRRVGGEQTDGEQVGGRQAAATTDTTVGSAPTARLNALPNGVAAGVVAGAAAGVAVGAVADAAAVVSIVNGVLDTIDVRKPGVVIRTLNAGTSDEAGTQTVQEADIEATGELLGSVMDDAVDFFAEANLAFTSTPVVVDIAPGAVLDGPVLICAHTDADALAWFPRLVVVAGAGSEAVVVEQHTSADVDCLVCPVTELRVEQSARLSHMMVQQMGPRAWQIASLDSRLDAGASLANHHIALGGGYARARIDTHLAGKGSHAELSAAYFGRGDAALDFRTYQHHIAPDTTSNLLFKGALDDHSRAVYTGLIRIEPTASGVEALQTNRNLKLSPHAWAESVPNLEIENNDVKCSHASATGPVDPEQRFYLERLGVPSDAAESLVVRGFFDEVFDTLPVRQIGAAASEHIAALLTGRLEALS